MQAAPTVSKPQIWEFPFKNTWKLTNVSIWRNQATNRPLSPKDIPDVYPWQPGLREAYRLCLTAVLPALARLRAGLTASRGEPLWSETPSRANCTTQYSLKLEAKRSFCRGSKQVRQLMNVINEPVLHPNWLDSDSSKGQAGHIGTVAIIKP